MSFGQSFKISSINNELQNLISSLKHGNATPLNVNNGTLVLNPITRTIGINKTNPLYNLDVSGSAKFTTIIDVSNSSGTSGQVLVSTGSGFTWSEGASSSQIDISTSNTNQNFYLTFVPDISGKNNIFVDNNALVFNPNSNRLGVGLSSPAYNLDVSGNTYMSGQIVASNGAGLNGQVLTVNAMGKMEWKDVSGSGGGTANSIQVNDISNNQNYYLTFVKDTSGGNNLYIDSNSFVINPGTNRIGLNNLNPSYNIDVSTNDLSGMRIGRVLFVDASNNIVTVSGRLQSTILLDSTNSSGNTNLYLRSTPSGLLWSSLGVTSSQWTSDGSGNIYFPASQTDISRVGIGTITPTYKLDISNSDVSAMRVGRALLVDASNNIVTVSGRLQSTILLDSTNSSGNTNLYLRSTPSGLLWSSLGVTSSQWTSDGSGNIYFPSSQTDISRVGIGTIAPTYKLDISNSDVSAMRVGRALLVDASNNIVTVSGRLQSTILLDSTNSSGNTNLYLRSTPSGLLWSSVASGSSQWTSDGSGNIYFPSSQTDISRVGIGVINPTYKLDISNSDVSAMRVGRALFVDASNNIVTVSGRLQSTIILDSTNSSGNTNLYLRSTPTGLLWSSVASGSSQWTSDGSGNIYFPASLTDLSNVGIGIINPTFKLDVSGETNIRTTNVRIGRNAGEFSQQTSGIAIGVEAGYNGQGTSSIAIGVQAGWQGQDVSSIAIGYQAGYVQQRSNAIAIGASAGATGQGRSSIAIGENAGATAQGNCNVAIGFQAGKNSQFGNYNVAVGYEAGYNSQSYVGVAIGSQAGYNSQGQSSIAIGENAGRNNQLGNSIAIGYYAGCNSQNQFSVALGYGAGSIGQLQNSIAIGLNAGTLSQSVDSIAIGSYAGYNSQSCNSIAIGCNAGNTGQQQSAIAIGTSAGRNSQGQNAIAIGERAGTSDQRLGGIAIGYQAGDISQQTFSIAIGGGAGSNSQQQDSIAIGNGAGNCNQGTNSIAIGFQAGSNSQDISAIAIGNQAGQTAQRRGAVAIGFQAGFSSQGSNAVAIGCNAGYFEQKSSAVGIGYFAGQYGQNVNSIAIGNWAGRFTQQQSAVAIGNNAGYQSQGSSAVAIGDGAGRNNQRPNSVAIGNNSGDISQQESAVAIGFFAGRTNQQTGAIAIGLNAGLNSQQQYSIAIGTNAGSSGQDQIAVAIGLSAGTCNQGSSSIAIGTQAGQSAQGTLAIAIGLFAGNSNQGSSAIAIGTNAGQTSQGQTAIAIGSNAGNTGQDVSAIAIGNNAGVTNQRSNAIAIGPSAGASTQGADAVAIGNNAGQNTQGPAAVAIGFFAGNTAQGQVALAIGFGAGYNSQGQSSIAIGFSAGYCNQGSNSIAIGTSAGFSGQNSNAIAIGSGAANRNQGTNSIAIGRTAGFTNQSSNSIAIGFSAGYCNQDISSIAIGTNAGFTNQRNGAIAIGPQAGANSQQTNSVAIGASAAEFSQGQSAVAIGNNAGSTRQGNRAVAIGFFAGNISQAANSIVLHASTDASLNTSNSGLYVAPLRTSTSTSYPLVYDLSSKEIAYNDTANVETFSVPINTVTANTDVSLGASYFFPFPTSGAGAAGPLNTLSAMSSATSYSPLQYSFIAPTNCILKGGYGYFQVGSSDAGSPTDVSATFSIARIASDVSLSTFSPTLITDVSTGNFITSGASTTTSSRATRFILPSTSSTTINAGDLIFLRGTIAGSGATRVNYPTITGTLLFRRV